MHSILGLLVLSLAICAVIANQYIGLGAGAGDDSDERIPVWSDSAHSADTDAALKRLEAMENIGKDAARNFDESNWGGDAFDKGFGSDADSDSDGPHRVFQMIQF